MSSTKTINYVATHTLSQFHQDDTFYRGVKGPFGCYSGRTEILTSTGWQYFNEWDGAPVAQYDADTENMEFVEPLAYIKLPCNDFILFKNSYSMWMELSPEHRVLYKDWADNVKVRSAEYIEEKINTLEEGPRFKVPTTFRHDGGGLPYSDNEIRLMVAFKADGNYPGRGRKVSFAFRKERKKRRLRKLLDDLQIEYYERTCKGRKTETVFSFEWGYRNKEYTSEWYKASQRQLDLIFDEVFHWDGHDSESLLGFFSNSKKCADYIQYVCSATGHRATLTQQSYEYENWNPTYRVNVTRKYDECVTFRNTDTERIPSVDGYKYCFTVPTGFLVVRCNGRVFVSGNSGKSVACCMEIMRRARQMPKNKDGIRRSRWAIVRNSYKELERTTMKTWFEWFPEDIFGVYKRNEKVHYVRFDDVDLEVIFQALDKPDDVKKLLSMELTGAWINEAREVPKAIIDAVGGRVTRFPKKTDYEDGTNLWFGVIMDTNPPDTDHWWYKLAEEPDHYVDRDSVLSAEDQIAQIRKEYKFWDQPSGRSPLAENRENLNDPRYYERLAIGKDPEWVKVYVDGQYGFIVDGRPVFPEYVDNVHAVDTLSPIQGVPIIRGWDFGLCYDDQTEVLTADGWKLFKDVDVELDLIFTKDPETNSAYYTKAAFKIDKEYSGEMLCWESQNVNMCVTPEHIIPYTNRGTPDITRWADAEYLAQHMSGHHYVDLTSHWDRPFDNDEFEFAGFMGIYLSEGCVDKNRISVYQNNRNQDIEEVLPKCISGTWKWTGRGWRCTDKRLAEYLKKFGKAGDKYVPFELKNAHPAVIKEFIRMYTIGDGHIRTRDNGSVEHTIFSISKRMVDDLQEMAQKVGWNSSIRKVGEQTSYLDGRKIWSAGGYSITFKKRAKRAELRKKNFSRIQYNGRVYCLNVPHHTLYVRRNGVPSWNGNTPSCMFMQVSPRGQVLVLDEMVSESIGIERFSDNVIRYSGAMYPGYRFVDYGDPAGSQRAQTDEKTVFSIMHTKNIMVEPGKKTVAARLESVKKYLNSLVDGRPGFLLNKTLCKTLRRGFLGGYQYRRMQTSGFEKFTEVPDKNRFSHVHDALQYAMSGAVGDTLFIPEGESEYQEVQYAQKSTRSGRSRTCGY